MKPDKITESIDYIFKMREDGRMDKEEACLAVGAILSGELSEKELEMFRFIYLFRGKEDLQDVAQQGNISPNASGVTITIEIKK